jgi:hypothetical protein
MPRLPSILAHDEYGLRLMITVLWSNYLAGTHGDQLYLAEARA